MTDLAFVLSTTVVIVDILMWRTAKRTDTFKSKRFGTSSLNRLDRTTFLKNIFETELIRRIFLENGRLIHFEIGIRNYGIRLCFFKTQIFLLKCGIDIHIKEFNEPIEIG